MIVVLEMKKKKDRTPILSTAHRDRFTRSIQIGGEKNYSRIEAHIHALPTYNLNLALGDVLQALVLRLAVHDGGAPPNLVRGPRELRRAGRIASAGLFDAERVDRGEHVLRADAVGRRGATPEQRHAVYAVAAVL